jgi:hypothetical protein
MPFRLTNVPATFQTIINNILREHLDKFIIVYLDDILIYSETFEEYRKHVHTVLQALERANLLVEPKKCEFHKQTVRFLGYEISPGQVYIDPAKIQTIKEWTELKTVKEIRAFLSFANFYHKFITRYRGIATLLTDLTKKDKTFTWGTKEQIAFNTLKERLLKEPVLYTANPKVLYEVETDTSDYTLSGQLGQRDKKRKLHPVAFYSLKLKGPELNYAIYDKEFIAIIEAFKKWKHYLMGTKHKIKVYIDHKNFTIFTTTKELNKKQIRWYEFLSEFDFEIIYRKGSENGRVDALSRREDLKPTESTPTTVMLKTNEKNHLKMGTKHLNTTWVVKPDDT